jgi:hypothetical protein
MLSLARRSGASSGALRRVPRLLAQPPVARACPRALHATPASLGLLKGIEPLLTADLLHVLRSAGHGDEIVLVDCNFPACARASFAVRVCGSPGRCWLTDSDTSVARDPAQHPPP